MRESSIVVGGCINGNRLNCCVVGDSFLVKLNFVEFGADLYRVVTRAQIRGLPEEEKGYKKYYCFCSCNML